MKIDLSNKNFLVTGSAGIGVGSGICKAIDCAGGNLVINDLSAENVKEATKKYNNAIGVVADISKSEEVDRLFHEIKTRYCSSTVIMLPASEGTGVIAGNAMRAVFEAVGVENV